VKINKFNTSGNTYLIRTGIMDKKREQKMLFP